MSACRTPIGRMGGAFADVSAVELGATVIQEVISRANVAPEDVDHVQMGCVIQDGLGQNVARQAAVKGGACHNDHLDTEHGVRLRY